MKRLVLAAALAAAVLLLSSCSTGELPKGMDKNAVCERAIAVVDAVCRGDYTVLPDDLPDGQTPEARLDAIQTRLAALGGFPEYRLIQAVGSKSSDGAPSAVVILNCAFENGAATFTLSFDTGYRLTGIYLK